MEEKKEKKKSLIKFGIVIFLWLLLIGSLSYAYFSVVLDSSNQTVVDVETGLLDVNFVTGEYINNNEMWPMNDSDIFTSDDVSQFSVSRNENNTTQNVYYNIYLSDIVIDNNYKSEYIKWRLYDVQNPTSSSTSIGEGTFEDIGDSTSIQLNRTRISLPSNTTHNYTLFIWISNDENNNQIDLLNGTLRGKVSVTAVSQ